MSVKELRGVIDDGTREIPIDNTFGKLICNIYIRPADISILDRYNSIATDIKAVVEPLKKLNSIQVDGTVRFKEEWAIMKQAEAELKRRINILFDMDEADEIFAKRNPFSSVGGKFFCESVIDVIGDIITEAVEEELELSKKRMEKYLDDLPDEKPDESEKGIASIHPISREVSGDDRTVTTDS